MSEAQTNFLWLNKTDARNLDDYILYHASIPRGENDVYYAKKYSSNFHSRNIMVGTTKLRWEITKYPCLAKVDLEERKTTDLPKFVNRYLVEAAWSATFPENQEMVLFCMDIDDVYAWLEETKEHARAIRKEEDEKKPMRRYRGASANFPFLQGEALARYLEEAGWEHSLTSSLLEKKPDLKYYWKRLGSHRPDWDPHTTGAYSDLIVLVGIDHRLYKKWLEWRSHCSDVVVEDVAWWSVAEIVPKIEHFVHQPGFDIDDPRFIVAGIDLLIFDSQAFYYWLDEEYFKEARKIEGEDRARASEELVLDDM